MTTRRVMVAILVLVSMWSSQAMSGSARMASPGRGQWSRAESRDLIDQIFYPEPRHRAEFIAIQKRLVADYGGPDGVWNAIMAGFFIPPHLGAVITGAGFALGNWFDLTSFEQTGLPSHGLDPNYPFFLLYAPTGRPAPTPDGREGTFDDIWADPPFELIGWIYGAKYNPLKRPHIDGIPDEAWFVHEAGWHMSDGSQILTPPREECPGELAQDPPNPPGPVLFNQRGELIFPLMGHGRAWDVHLWVNPDINQTPVITTDEPFSRLPAGTLDLPKGAFFFPFQTFDSGPRGLRGPQSRPRCR